MTGIDAWIPVAQRLPQDGERVLVYNGSYEIAVFNRGVSQEERERMRTGLSPDREEVVMCATEVRAVRRSDRYTPYDEGFGNTVPYAWKAVGGWIAGQDVTHWMPLPDKPKGGDNDG